MIFWDKPFSFLFGDINFCTKFIYSYKGKMSNYTLNHWDIITLNCFHLIPTLFFDIKHQQWQTVIYNNIPDPGIFYLPLFVTISPKLKIGYSIVDGVQPKMPPLLSFYGTQQNQFLLCSNPTSTQAGYHQTIFMMIFI